LRSIFVLLNILRFSPLCSDSPITFSWRSFATNDEEAIERQRLLKEINRMENIEMNAFTDSLNRGDFFDAGTDGDGDLSDESIDGGNNMPFSARAVEAALIRKYRNLRTALEKDPMMFVDDIFEVSPVSGQVWSNSEMEVTVTFHPDTQALFNCLAYLDISGREDRLNLNLTGQGIGPQASLSYDVLDTGDVFINDDQSYTVTITNKGDIPASWGLLSSLTRFGKKFQFSPDAGHLIPGESQLVEIKFTSDILGEFSEHFRFSLQGNDDVLLFQVKGHVIGPTFHLDCKSIDFGVVSYDYLHTATTRLVNSSKIPMMYSLHIPQDGNYLKREFDISPSEGVLVPGEFVDVVIEFIPSQVKVYEYSLAVDVYGVGDMLLSTPIHAECIVSTVQLAKRDLHYGDCFLRYPYITDFVLMNSSQVVRTKFEILPQQAHTTSIATFEADPSVGFIEPGESFVVKVKILIDKLGQSKVPIALTIAGSLEPPIQAALNFTCIGPRVIVEPREVKWGNVECLKNDVRSVRVTNDSLIPAALNFFMKVARSRFDIIVREAVLEPQQSLDLEITANVDDTIVHKDELHVIVADSDNLMVPLSAKGTGTTMYCSQDIQVLDFGPQLTNTGFERRITLENKGRRPQQLRWFNETAKIENASRAAKVKAMKVAPSTLPKHLAPVESVFSVYPTEVTLRSRTATTFVFRGISVNPGLLSEIFVLESKVGKDRNMISVIRTNAQAEIMNPLLEFSEKDLNFTYSWTPSTAPTVVKKNLVLTNKSAVTLNFMLKTEIPFNLNLWEHTLAPDESLTLTVEYDPLYRDDKESCTVEKLLVIQYRGHSQRDSIKLTGENIFPNIKFESTSVAFGCILNETEKRIRLKMTNSSKVVVSYSWQFMENEVPNKSAKGMKPRAMSSLQASIPPNQAFDILPIRSILQPGERYCLYYNLGYFYIFINAKF
jgi:hydrocephalus-inducing protein